MTDMTTITLNTREPTYDERLIGLYEVINRVTDERDSLRKAVTGLERALGTECRENDELRGKNDALTTELAELKAALEHDYKPRHRWHRNTTGG